jgi:hypothetical protein
METDIDIIAEAALDQVLAAYSQGKMSRKELERATGLWFGEILVELARCRLPLPRVDTRVHFNEAQHLLYRRVFG